MAKLSGATPDAYYLGQSEGDSSLLLFRVRVGGADITVQESFTAFFVTAQPKLRSATSVSSEDVIRILNEWTTFGEHETASLELPDSIDFESVFTNSDTRHIFRVIDWREDVFGFISSDGRIHLLLSKIAGMRKRVDFVPDYRWIDDQLDFQTEKTR